MAGTPFLLLGVFGTWVYRGLKRKAAADDGDPAGGPRRRLPVDPISRRQFVAASAGSLTALGDFAFLGALPAAAADKRNDQTTVVPLAGRHRTARPPDRRHAARTTARKVAAKVRAGTSYQQLLGAVMLAGVRGIKPRPVGFQFHAVLVINSAHLASLAATDHDRWLPLFWALDNFKASQATNAKQNAGWVMPALDESKVPSADAARKRFTEAMDNWDEEAADAAVAGLARSAGADEVIELFWRYGAAISATSATRRSSSPTPGGRCRPSAGAMPSRCCGRWRSPCWNTKATTRPSATPSPTAPAART